MLHAKHFISFPLPIPPQLCTQGGAGVRGYSMHYFFITSQCTIMQMPPKFCPQAFPSPPTFFSPSYIVEVDLGYQIPVYGPFSPSVPPFPSSHFFYSLPSPFTGAVGEAVGEADGEADRTETLSVTTTGTSPGNRRVTSLQKSELLQQK